MYYIVFHHYLNYRRSFFLCFILLISIFCCFFTFDYAVSQNIDLDLDCVPVPLRSYAMNIVGIWDKNSTDAPSESVEFLGMYDYTDFHDSNYPTFSDEQIMDHYRRMTRNSYDIIGTIAQTSDFDPSDYDIIETDSIYSYSHEYYWYVLGSGWDCDEIGQATCDMYAGSSHCQAWREYPPFYTIFFVNNRAVAKASTERQIIYESNTDSHSPVVIVELDNPKIKININFEDNNNALGSRPESITFESNLSSDRRTDNVWSKLTFGESSSSPFRTCTASSNTSWSCTINDFDLYGQIDTGNPYWQYNDVTFSNFNIDLFYQVFTNVPDGYTANVEYVPSQYVQTYNITYTLDYPELINVTVIKDWEDDDDRDHYRPMAICMTLSAAANTVKEEVWNHTLNDNENEWCYVFENLVKFYEGNLITYTIDENPGECLGQIVKTEDNCKLSGGKWENGGCTPFQQTDQDTSDEYNDQESCEAAGYEWIPAGCELGR